MLLSRAHAQVHFSSAQVKCILFESYKAILTRIVQQSLINTARKIQIIYKGRRMKRR